MFSKQWIELSMLHCISSSAKLTTYFNMKNNILEVLLRAREIPSFIKIDDENGSNIRKKVKFEKMILILRRVQSYTERNKLVKKTNLCW